MKTDVKDKETAVNATAKNRKFKKQRRGKGDSKVTSFIAKGPNDIKWRTNTPLAKLAGTFPFGLPAGLEFKDYIYSDLAGSSVSPLTIPGIMAIRMQLTVGDSNNYNSAINLASRKIYSFVRHQNSGSKNYEAADLTSYLLAVGQALGLLGWLQRIYRTIRKFSTTNRYYPRELLTMQGLNYDDLRQHQAELAWLIKWLGASVNSLAYPKMPFFDACYFAFSKYFSDNTSPKEQVYLYTPECFGVYDPTIGTAGGGVSYTELFAQIPTGTAAASGSGLQFGALDILAHQVMDVLLSDEDIGIMSGDILKAYGEGGLNKVTAEADDVIEMEHSEEILQQIHNVSCLPFGFARLESYTQQIGSTSTAPYVKSNVNDNASFSGLGSGGRSQPWIDAFSGDPQYDEVFNCCVLKAHFIMAKPTGQSVYFVDHSKCYFGCYLPTRIEVGSGVGTMLTVFTYDSAIAPNTGGFNSTQTRNNIIYAINFDWHPVWMFLTNGVSYMLGDIQNLTFIWYDKLARVHETEMLSLLDLANNI